MAIITKDALYARIGAVSLERFKALETSMSLVLKRATGQYPEQVAAQMREEAAELRLIEDELKDDIDELRARISLLTQRVAHVDEIAGNIETAAGAIASLPYAQHQLSAELMGDDMPGSEHQVVWSAANAPADEVDESGDLIVGSRDIVADENEE